MLEHLVIALLSTFVLGLATWHIAHVIRKGSLFEPLRRWLERQATEVWFQGERGGKPGPHLIKSSRFVWWWRSWDCRLCLGTEIAITLTWGLLGTGLVVDRHALPAAEWGFAFAVGPFLTGAWSEVIRRVESLKVPD